MSRGEKWIGVVSKLVQIAFISVCLFSTKYHCLKSSSRASCFYDHHKYRHGEKFSPDGGLSPCETCHCNNGEVTCSVTGCPDISSCRKEDIVKLPEECCSKCSKATSSFQKAIPLETTPTSNLLVIRLPPPPMLPPPPPSITAIFSANQSHINQVEEERDQNSGENACYLDESKVLLECIDENGKPIILRGPSGPKGEKGARGKRGKKGGKGDDGIGITGPIGPKGSIGLPGERGDPGPQGNRGKKGDKGEPANNNVMGIKGERGAIGPPGNPGPVGPQGRQGPAGRNGARGEKGERGEPGVSIVTGEKGTHCVPGVLVVPDAPSMNEITTEGMLAYCQGDQKLYFRDRSSWRTVQMDDPSQYETTSKETNKVEEVLQIGTGSKCGNGRVDVGEECDDGNPNKSDNCIVRNNTIETDTTNSTDLFPATSGHVVTRWRCVFTTLWTSIVLAIASSRLSDSILR